MFSTQQLIAILLGLLLGVYLIAIGILNLVSKRNTLDILSTVILRVSDELSHYILSLKEEEQERVLNYQVIGVAYLVAGTCDIGIILSLVFEYIRNSL